MKKKLPPSDFVKLYSDFQGNMNEDIIHHFLYMLPAEQKPLMFLLINKENEFEMLESAGIHLKDFKINIDTHWTKKVTEEHLKLLEKYNYQYLDKMYVSIITSMGQQEAKSYIFKNADLKRLNSDQKISITENFEQIIENKYVNLDSLKKIPILNNYGRPHFLTEDNFKHLINKYSVDDIVQSVENNTFYGDILSYMFKKDLIGLDTLNKEDSNGIPLFNRFFAFASYLNIEKTGMIEGLKFEKVNGIKNIFSCSLPQYSDEADIQDLFVKMIPPQYINLKNEKNENILYLNLLNKKSTDVIKNIRIFMEKGGSIMDKSNENKYFFENSYSISLLMNLVINPSILNIYAPENVNITLTLRERLKSLKERYTAGRDNGSEMIEQITTLEVHLEKGLLNNTFQKSEVDFEKNIKKRL